MSELRRDRISGQWVVVAPRRGKRPHQIGGEGSACSAGGADERCPFCPGNEDLIPAVVAEYAGEGLSGWDARVIPNRYAALADDLAAVPHTPAFTAMPAFGHQEVIIESPRHDADLRTLGDGEMVTVIRAFRDRFAEIIGREGISYATLFRNYGPTSGASQAHPHSQLIGTGHFPERLRFLEERAKRYFEEHGACITCEDLRHELAASSRIVENAGSFVAYVPFAAQYPSELWIVPNRHQARFDEISDAGMEAFGLLLRRSLRRVFAVHGDVSYNFAIDSAGRDGLGSPHLHWRLRFAPKLARRGGFELGTDVPFIPSSPEDDARALRAVDPN